MFEANTISQAHGPILVVSGVEGAKFDEIVHINMPESEKRIGKVLEVNGDKAVVQVFEGTSGIPLEGTTATFTGNIQEMPLSEDMLGRVFDGAGNPIDGAPQIIPEKLSPISGAAINPYSRDMPEDFIQTGISTIDTLFTVVRGQKIPIFSGSGLPHSELAAQIARQASVKSQEGSSDFVVVFAAMGVTFEESQYFINEFKETGALEHAVIFANTADNPVVERISTPRLALTTAEYLAFEKDKHVLVIMTDMTNYAEALREVSAAQKQVPGRRGYPGYLYTDLSTLYERAGRVSGKKGSITQIPILAMPEDDKTHPIPDLTGYITEGQIVLDRKLYNRGIYPAVNIAGSLSRLMGNGLGDGKTREDHKQVSDQLFSVYAKGLEVRELAVVLGESSLSETDKAYMKFSDTFEKKFMDQKDQPNRNIEESLDIAWEIFTMIPDSELKKLKPDMKEKYGK